MSETLFMDKCEQLYQRIKGLELVMHGKDHVIRTLVLAIEGKANMADALELAHGEIDGEIDDLRNATKST